ncbi:hypothetical protein GOV03_04535 [Candidatus Woesearchaeota archaeon]|nr:hypothetical protein [Candidatus Woesearchaeota archaeon]
MQDILAKVLKKIKPTAAETKKFQSTTNQFIKKLNTQLKKIQAKAILGGSGEKDTWLSGSHDIDIFVQFDYKKYKNSEDLSNLLEEALKKAVPKFTRLHGSRDYFQTKHQNFLFEIVPILKITKSTQAVNITDISPLHAQWVKKSPKLVRDQIRLVKKFIRANDCYGAESHIAGLSGYVLEILTIHYGSFEKLIRAAAKWEHKDIFDVKQYYQRHQIFKDINPSKLRSPLIVIDPVDKTRNAAAAFGMEKFLLIKQKARDFLKEPHLKSFEREKVDFKKLEKQTKYNLVYIEINPLTGKDDVVGSKLLKSFLLLKKKLIPFKIKEAQWKWDTKAIFYFILEKKQIDQFYIQMGPPLKFTEHVETFKKKHKSAFQEGNKIMAKIPVDNYKLEEFVKEVLQDKYIKERIKSVKSIKFG